MHNRGRILEFDLDDDYLELVAMLLEKLAQVPSLALRAHRASNGEACLKETLDDPDGDVAVRPSDEDLPGRDRWHAESLCGGFLCWCRCMSGMLLTFIYTAVCLSVPLRT